MKKLLDWIKNHTGVTILICVLLFVVPLVTVHILFKIPAWSNCLVAEWSAGELLAYIAGFEALTGTVFLGLITLDQAEQANTVSQQLGKENNEMQKIMAQKLLPIIRMEKARLMPVVSPNACPENFPMATQFRRTGSFHSSTPSEIQQNIYINIDINTDNDEPVYVLNVKTDEELYDLDQTDICVMNYKIINFQMCEAYFKNKRIDTEQQLRKTIRLYSIDEFSQMGDDLEQCQEMLKKVLNESADEHAEAKG